MEFRLQEFVAERLAMFKVPYRIKFLSETPKDQPANLSERVWLLCWG